MTCFRITNSCLLKTRWFEQQCIERSWDPALASFKGGTQKMQRVVSGTNKQGALSMRTWRR